MMNGGGCTLLEDNCKDTCWDRRTHRSTHRSTPPDPKGSSSALASPDGPGRSPGSTRLDLHIVPSAFCVMTKEVTSPPQLLSGSKHGLSPVSEGWPPQSPPHWWSAPKQQIFGDVKLAINQELRLQRTLFWKKHCFSLTCSTVFPK